MKSLGANDADVIIVGTGLAGLRCAQILNEHGRTVILLDKNDYVGGRLHSFRIDDYVIDEGFQLVNPSYPEIVASGVLQNFDLRTFDPLIDFYREGKSFAIGDPRKYPLSSLRGLYQSHVTFSDVRKLVATLAKCAWMPAKKILAQPDVSTLDGLRELGLSKAAINDVLSPFLRGTLLSDDLSSSWNYTQLLLKSFAHGSPGTHPAGIEALATAFVKRLTQTSIHLNTVVQSVGPSMVVTSNGAFKADDVVMATDGNSAQSLVDSPPPSWNSQTTWWWSLPKQQETSALRIDLDDRLLSSALDLSSKAPERCPRDRSLVATPMNGDCPSTDLEERARQSVGRLFSVEIADVDLVTTTVVPLALPRLAVPLKLRGATKRNGTYCAGDYLETPSIQGALASGAKCARAILAN